MAKKVRGILFVSLLIFVIQVRTQDVGFIVLVKGSASVIYSGSDKPVDLREGTRLPLPLTTYIVLPANSSAIVYNEKSKIEIGSIVEEPYKTVSLIESLKKEKTSSMASNFYRYMNRMYAQMKQKEESQGTVVGAVSRGFMDSPPEYSPPDSVVVLSDAIELKWSIGTRLISNLIVINETTADTVYNSLQDDDSLLLKSLSSGFYSWSYDLVEIGKSLMFKYRNIFIIPPTHQKRILMSEYENFINEVSDLSPAVQVKLRNEFITRNQYYFQPKAN
jgi:hypothetical protein